MWNTVTLTPRRISTNIQVGPLVSAILKMDALMKPYHDTISDIVISDQMSKITGFDEPPITDGERAILDKHMAMVAMDEREDEEWPCLQ